MYPRVKVRAQGQEEYDDQFEIGKRSLQSLKVPEFLSSNDFSSPDDSPTSVVRVPRSDSFNPGAVDSRKQKTLEENSPSIIRPSPVLRPRAVLSSPDNDQLIGSKNRIRKEALSGTKKGASLPNKDTKGSKVAADAPVNTRRELKEVAASRTVLHGRQRTVSADPSLKSSLRKGSPRPFPDRQLSNSPLTKR